MKIFVVSLIEAVDRRRSIESNLTSLGLEFEFFDAVRGSELSQSELEHYCDSNTLQDHKKWMSPGAIGCAISHFEVYQMIIEQNLDRAVVLEDDMLVQEDFRVVMDHLERMPLSREVILLYYRSAGEVRLDAGKPITISDRYNIYTPFSNGPLPNTTGGYCISIEACRSLIDYLHPIRMASDSWRPMLESGQIDQLRVVYPRPLMDAGFKSDIDYVDAYYHPFVARILKWINRYRLPPFYALLNRRRKRLETAMSRFTLVYSE